MRRNIYSDIELQLRHRWDAVDEDCYANICDAEFRYWHEYLGNTPRLVRGIEYYNNCQYMLTIDT